jgi:hypothetical protein
MCCVCVCVLISYRCGMPCAVHVQSQCHNPGDNITKLQVNLTCRSVETVKHVCKLTSWKAENTVTIKKEVKLNVTIKNAQVYKVLKTSNKIFTFWVRGQAYQQTHKCQHQRSNLYTFIILYQRIYLP